MSQLALDFPGGPNNIINENDPDIFGSLWKLGSGSGPGGQLLPADIINKILPFVFVIAGLILFFMFIFGGFTIFVSAGNPEKIKKGQGMIVNGLIGFMVIFAAYWIIQFLEITLGIKLL